MAARRWAAWVKPLVRYTLGLLVLGAVVHQAIQVWNRLQAQPDTLRPNWPVIAAAAVPYVLGLLACGRFFHLVLRSSASPIGLYAAERAYLLSHLAKYVPGKALVVVVRSALAAQAGARVTTAACATFYETFVMMAAGCLVAAAGFTVSGGGRIPLSFGRAGPIEVPLSLVSMALACAFLVAVWPAVFRRVAGLVFRPFRDVAPDAVPVLNPILLGRGLLWSGGGWVLMGLSQVVILMGLLPDGLAPGVWPAVIASVALAIVAGFVVPIAPGGLGIREWVLWTSLGSARINPELAVVGALLYRLVSVAAELAIAAMVAAVKRTPVAVVET